MTYAFIKAGATIESLHFKGLKENWRLFGKRSHILISKMVVLTPLTPAQRKSLSRELRAKLVERAKG